MQQSHLPAFVLGHLRHHKIHQPLILTGQSDTELRHQTLHILSIGEYLREALEGWRSTKGDEHWRTHWALHYLANLLRDRDKLDEAERLGAEAVRKGRQTWVNERPQGAARFPLGHARTLIALERFEQAEAELLETQAMFEDSGVPIRIPENFRKHTRKLAEAFVDLYEAWHAAEPEAGHDAKVADWRKKLTAAEAEGAD